MEAITPPKLLDRFRQAMRLKHQSHHTEQTSDAMWAKISVFAHSLEIHTV
jgi:di/tripeptidase